MLNSLVTVREALARVFSAYQNGAFSDAERLCRALLEFHPDLFQALYLLAVTQVKLGHKDAALVSYERALVIRSDHVEALANYAALLQEFNRLDEALATCDTALAIKPDDVVALTHRASILLVLNRYNEALAGFERAIAVDSSYADAFYNRGVVFQQLKQFEAARQSYEQVLALRPKHVGALRNQGTVLWQLNRFEDAQASYELALVKQPDDAFTLNNRAAALKDLGRFDDALVNFDRAIAVKPDFTLPLYNAGLLLHQLRRFARAATNFAAALAISPDLPYAKGWLLSSRMNRCEWSSFATELEDLLLDVRAGRPACYPFPLLGLSASARDQLRCSEVFVRDLVPQSPPPIWRGERYRHDRIRVAYLSADFRDHAVCRLLAGVFEQHDRTQFETTALSFGPDTPSDMRSRVQRAFDRFIDVRSHKDVELANLLRELEIDIAVDLMGYTKDHRCKVFAFRPAPIQVNYLGYPGTIGAEYMDYIIADPIVIPAEQRQHYREQVVWLPDSFQANDSMRRMAEGAETRAAVGLPESSFVFCAFSNTYKITPIVFDVWMRLLQDVDESVLWLIGGAASVENNLVEEAKRRGVSPDRLIFLQRVDYPTYLSRYCLADLFLDTFPFNAGATASDALWSGLPLVTCSGEAFASRMAASLLTCLGLPELIAPSLERYEMLAIELARNKDYLTAIRTKLQRRRADSPLFNTTRFRRHLETAYKLMWERYQRGEPLRHLAVENEDVGLGNPRAAVGSRLDEKFL